MKLENLQDLCDALPVPRWMLFELINAALDGQDKIVFYKSHGRDMEKRIDLLTNLGYTITHHDECLIDGERWEVSGWAVK